MKHETPGQNKVIPGSLDKLSKSVISLDCPGQPWTVGNYAIGINIGVNFLKAWCELGTWLSSLVTVLCAKTLSCRLEGSPYYSVFTGFFLHV